MPYLIGEMSDGIVVAVEVNTAVFKSFNKMAKNAGRMGTKYDFIGEIFTSIKAGGGELNEDSIRQYISES